MIDPVIVLLDKEGQILAVGDDWDEELDAFVSIDEVPSGSRVIVFDINGDDGTFDIEIDSLEKYEWELESDKEYESFILGEKENEEWDDRSLLGGAEPTSDLRIWCLWFKP